MLVEMMMLSVLPRRCRSITNVSQLMLVAAEDLNSSIPSAQKGTAAWVGMTAEICNSQVFLYQNFLLMHKDFGLQYG